MTDETTVQDPAADVAPATVKTMKGLQARELVPIAARVVVESIDGRPETLAEVVARVGLADPDPVRKDPVAALFEANRGLIGSDPANTTAGMVLAVPA